MTAPIDCYPPTATRACCPLRAWLVLAALLAPVTCVDSDASPEDSAEKVEESTATMHHGAAPAGRWRTAPKRESTLDEEAHRLVLEQLESIGYLTGSQLATGASLVTVHDAARAYGGYNLFSSGHAPEALLIDMDGKVLHRWHCRVTEAAPEIPRGRAPFVDYFRRFRLGEDGALFAIFEGWALVKLDKHSRILWAYTSKAHHDLDVVRDPETGEERIYVLVRTPELIPHVDPDNPVMDDSIVVLDGDGRELRRVSVLEAFERSEWTHLLDRMDKQGNGELFHTNTIEVLDGRLEARSPAFRAGNVLVSSRHLDAIAVIDMQTETVVWCLTGSWRQQHQPTVLEGGTLLLFDNLGDGPKHGRSRILELDPVSGEIIWTYAGTAGRPFQSLTCGSSQRLPNGNTLISESDAGRAFEITPDGEMVWEYINPHRAGEEGELIATLFEMVRFGPDLPLDWLD